MTSAPSTTFVTPRPWGRLLQHRQYGTLDTYRLAAAWLAECESVADWGGGAGFFRTCLPTWTRYTVIEGTHQADTHAVGRDIQVLADLVIYREPSDGILLRHVLDNTDAWLPILRNALSAFRLRLVVVTFTPDAEETAVAKIKSGWPVRHFNPADLRREMGDLLVRDDVVQTTHPERVYYLERPS